MAERSPDDDKTAAAYIRVVQAFQLNGVCFLYIKMHDNIAWAWSGVIDELAVSIL